MELSALDMHQKLSNEAATILAPTIQLAVQKGRAQHRAQDGAQQEWGGLPLQNASTLTSNRLELQEGRRESAA